MIKAAGQKDVNNIIPQYLLNINGITDYQIVAFTPTMSCDDQL